MNKKATLIITLQAVLIVTLFWILVFYGRDEFEAYQNEQEEEIESLNRVTTKEGMNIVSLSAATQQNSGIKTAPIQSTNHLGEIKSFGSVVNIDSLSNAKSSYLSLKADLGIAKSAAAHDIKQYQRLKSLNADDKNVSDQAVQSALAAVNANQAKITATELQLKNLAASTKLQWGEELAKLAFNDKLPEHLAALFARKNVLVQISLPLETQAPLPGSSVFVTPLNESVAPIQAVYVSPSNQSDTNGFGKTYYYSAPADLLRIGMRVNVETKSSVENSETGVIIPSNAVVWYAGKAWAYFKQGVNKQGEIQFVRKPISTANEVDEGWFNQGLDDNGEVVVAGAQLLLSEEFKYLIKNENED